MEIKVKDLKEKAILVKFGPISNSEKFKIDLLEVARRKLSIDREDFNELELKIGDRLGESPYRKTDRTTMPLTYLCEGSVWVNFCSPDNRWANVSLVPFLHGALSPHHNFWLYWTDFDGSKDCDKHIAGHFISKDEPIAISITCGEEIRKGTIDVRSRK
jgi:hypothetical protein